MTKEHQSMKSAAHHAHTALTKDAPTQEITTREKKMWGPISADTNPDIRLPMFMTNGYDTNAQNTGTPTWATTVPPQEERKPANTPAVDQLDQTPKLERMQPNAESDNQSHQEDNSTYGSVTIKPKTTKAPTEKQEIMPDQTQHIATTNDKQTKAIPLQPSTYQEPNPTVPYQNMAAHQVPHVPMMNPYTPNALFPPYISIPDHRPRDDHPRTPMAKYSTTRYSKLTEAETQQLEVPGALNNHQTKFLQPN